MLFYFFFFFFFNDTATTEIYTLSLHDALPISELWRCFAPRRHSRSPRIESIAYPTTSNDSSFRCSRTGSRLARAIPQRSEEHTSELQSRLHLVCRLLLEKKKKNESQCNNAHIY